MIRRGGFTLMEMILALAIGVMLLGALYLTINTQMEVNEQGREVVEQSALVRALFQRITQDAQTCLQAVDPRILPDTAVVSSSSSSTASGTSGTSSSSTSSGTTSGSTSSTSSSSSTSSDSSSSSGTTPMDAITIYNLGIEGDSSRLTISAARVPRELLARDKVKISAAQLPTVSDLRRISYWLIPAGDGGGVGGLARQELTGVTSLDADNVPPNIGNAASYIIAPEVTNLAFEYKGTSEAPEGSWSSTEQDIETGLLRGPPAAIIVHLSIRAKDGTEKTYRHVIALPTGNNYPPQ